jgi:hypothetical protein
VQTNFRDDNKWKKRTEMMEEHDGYLLRPIEYLVETKEY